MMSHEHRLREADAPTGELAPGQRVTCRRRHRRAVLAIALGIATLGVLASSASAASDSTAVRIPGSPLTIYVAPRGQCQSSYVVDGEVVNNYYPAFSQVGDCGFFLAFPTTAGQLPSLRGMTFGFEGTAGPGASAGPGVNANFTPVKQSVIGGDGSSSAPYTQTTEFDVVDSGLKKDALITETTTYLNGAPQFSSTYTVKNTSGSTIYFRAIYAGDLLVKDNDHGTGLFLAGPPRFVGAQNTDAGVVGGLQEAGGTLQWSSYQEGYWSSRGSIEDLWPGDNGIWHELESSVEEPRAFNGSTEASDVNNGVGVEWDQFRADGLAAEREQTFTIINRTQIPSDLQISPLQQVLTQGRTGRVTVRALDTAGQPYAARPLVYTVGGANPKLGSLTTDASGIATIDYVGTKAGLDVVHVFLDLARTGSKEPRDPSATSQITWARPPTAPNSSYKVKYVKANPGGTITITIVPWQDGEAVMAVTVPTVSVARRAVAATTRRCKKGRVRVKGKCRPKNTLSGRLTATGRAGVPLKLTVKPSHAVTKAVKRGEKVRLSAKLTYQSALGGKATTQTFHVTIPRRKTKHR